MKAILSLFFVAGIVQLPTVMGLPGKGFLRSVLNEAAEERVEDRVLDSTDDDTIVTVVEGPNCNYLFCLSGSDCQSGYCLDNQCTACSDNTHCTPNVCTDGVCTAP